MKARRFGMSRRAQSIIEFALVIPLLMLVILGIIAFGQLFSYRIRMDSAAREAARFGIVGRDDTYLLTVIRNRLNTMPGVNNVCGTSPAGQACMFVTFLPATCAARTVGADFVVTIRYDAYITVPVIGFFMSPKTLYARQVMRIEVPNCQG